MMDKHMMPGMPIPDMGKDKEMAKKKKKMMKRTGYSQSEVEMARKMVK